MATARSCEEQVIERHAIDIGNAISSCSSVDILADKLVEKEFISREKRMDVVDSGLPSYRKARQLVDAVMAQVRIDSSMFSVFMRILEEQAPLKRLADTMNEELKVKVQELELSGSPLVPTLQHGVSSSSAKFSPSKIECKWAIMIAELAEILTDSKALRRMKTALHQLVNSKSDEHSHPRLPGLDLASVETVTDFFELLAPYWNWVDCSLLKFVVEASGCKVAEEKLQEFMELRRHAAPHITFQVDDNEAISSQPQKASSSQGASCSQIAVMKVDASTMTLEDYDEKASLLSKARDISRYLLSFFYVRKGCIAIHWKLLTPVSLSPTTNLSLQALARQKIISIKISSSGSDITLGVATLSYWNWKPFVAKREMGQEAMDELKNLIRKKASKRISEKLLLQNLMSRVFPVISSVASCEPVTSS